MAKEDNREIRGKVYRVGNTQVISSNNGNTFQRRELVIDATQYYINKYTGEQGKIEDFIQVEFTGKDCELLDSFNEGEMVSVPYVLKGRKYEKDGKEFFFNTIRARGISFYNVFANSPHTQTANNSTTDSSSTTQPTSVIKPSKVNEPQTNTQETTNQVKDDLPF